MLIHHSPQRHWRSILSLFAVVLALVVGAAGGWLHGAGTARAPEPAQLTQGLGSTKGATAAAVGYSSGTPTTVVRWPGTYTSGGTVEAGDPCSVYGLGPGELATMFIVKTGNYSKCA